MMQIADEKSYLELFKNLSLKSDDVIFISSDISKMANTCRAHGEGLDVNKIIETLQEIIIHGSIVVPAYTDSLLEGDTFNWIKSKANTGAFSNKVMRRKDFIRTTDPLHSVLAWGKDQEKILALTDESTFGKNSIFNYLKINNAKFIFIDIHIQKCFTYIHFIEEQQNVKYRQSYHYNINCIYLEKEEVKRTHFYSKKLGVSSDINDLHAILVDKNCYSSFSHRGCQIDVLDAQTVWEHAVNCIYDGPYLYKFSLIKYLKDFTKRYVLRRKGIF